MLRPSLPEKECANAKKTQVAEAEATVQNPCGEKNHYLGHATSEGGAHLSRYVISSWNTLEACKTSNRRKPACIYARGNTTWQQSCSHYTAICKHRFQNTL